MALKTAALAVSLVAATTAQAIEMDVSGGVSMGLVSTSAPAGTPITPYVDIDARFDFSIETDGGVTIGLTLPVSAEGSADGWEIRISDQ